MERIKFMNMIGDPYHIKTTNRIIYFVYEFE